MSKSLLIEDYALIGNAASAGLVGKNGSIDWLCVPRFDSAACFAALLGKDEHGHWQIAPAAPEPSITRRYQENTIVLETEFSTPEGRCVLIDCMDREDDVTRVLRLVRGLEGSVALRMTLKIRFEYGSVIPWVTRMIDGRILAVAGPDQMVFSTNVETRGEDMSTIADFTIHAGEEIPFALCWRASHLPPPDAPDVTRAIERMADRSRDWASRVKPHGRYHEAVLRSLLTLKALIHLETGGMVAAPTTSLPESLGGSRNWDYRYCWLRDAAFTLDALLVSGFTDEAKSWRTWLLRAVAGSSSQLQIMYGIGGERRLTEFEVPWLPGYENSAPVRVGNEAAGQLQIDVFGEAIGLLYNARCAGLAESEDGWSIERSIVVRLGEIWEQPDSGIWEMRGPPRHFTHSKVMAWVAVDRAVATVEEMGHRGPLEEWRALRSRIHAEVCEKGFHPGLNSFVQYYGGETVDASLLILPMVGFLPWEDPRIVGTVAAIEKRLLRDGFVARYDTTSNVDGVDTREEGAFLACSFWLVENYFRQHRVEEARDLFERLLALRNDVGLLAEEYDAKAKRQVGNFPQAFSHVALINAARCFLKPADPPGD